MATALAASKEEGATMTWRCPCLPPPPFVVLVVVVAFDATSLLPAVAPVDCAILPPLGGDTRQCGRDHGGGNVSLPIYVHAYGSYIH